MIGYKRRVKFYYLTSILDPKSTVREKTRSSDVVILGDVEGAGTIAPNSSNIQKPPTIRVNTMFINLYSSN